MFKKENSIIISTTGEFLWYENFHITNFGLLISIKRGRLDSMEEGWADKAGG
jgi:hypothetical protein